MAQERKEVKTNNFGIDEGLVARRRDELLAQKLVVSQKKASQGTTPENNENSTESSEKQEGERRHPTMFRPRRQKVYPATEIPRSKRFPPKDNQEPSDKARLLHQTLLKAEQHYREHMKKGTNARAEKGWLSDWRHGDFGLKQAEKLCNELKNKDFDTMIEKLDKHFAKPQTKYNHSSFTPYLLDKINSLLEANSLPSHRVAFKEHYNASFWQIISEQLRMMPAEGGLPINEDKKDQEKDSLNIK